MIAISVLAVWAAAHLIEPRFVGLKPDREREGLRGPVHSVSDPGACSDDRGSGDAEAGAIFNNAESPVVAVLPAAAALAAAPLKPCRFPMRSDRERDGLLGPVQTVGCVRDPKLGLFSSCPSVVYDHDGWLQEQVWADIGGPDSPRNVFRRNPTTGNVEVEDLDKAGEPTGIKEVISCNEASGSLTEETFTAQGSAGRRVLSFDARGDLSTEESFYPDGSLNNRLIYTYDKHGHRSETVWDDPHSVAPGKTTFKYNTQGTLIEQDWYNKAGKLYSKEFFTYKLDSRGNWVERSIRSCEPSPGKPGELGCGAPTIERRRITYYDDGR